MNVSSINGGITADSSMRNIEAPITYRSNIQNND